MSIAQSERKSRVGPFFAEPGATYVLIGVALSNAGEQPLSYDPAFLKLHDAERRQYAL
jgi:hypothetical protein